MRTVLLHVVVLVVVLVVVVVCVVVVLVLVAPFAIFGLIFSCAGLRFG